MDKFIKPDVFRVEPIKVLTGALRDHYSDRYPEVIVIARNESGTTEIWSSDSTWMTRKLLRDAKKEWMNV